MNSMNNDIENLSPAKPITPSESFGVSPKSDMEPRGENPLGASKEVETPSITEVKTGEEGITPIEKAGEATSDISVGYPLDPQAEGSDPSRIVADKSNNAPIPLGF